MPEQQKQGKVEEQEEGSEYLCHRKDDSKAPLPLTATSRVVYTLGDITAGPAALSITEWLELVRKRTSMYRSSLSPRLHHPPPLPSSTTSSQEPIIKHAQSDDEQTTTTDISLWDRLGKAAMLDIDSTFFSWDSLSSLHHVEYTSSSNDHSEDIDINKPLEVTVNSGGVVFFAFFHRFGNNDASSPKEEAAVIKISSTRMATQSERLGYEFAKRLGVRTPQARVIHNTSPEWLQIKEAAEKARDAANSEGDETGNMTCSELLEALELSRCLFFMGYVHGSPLLESSSAFESQESVERISAALGRVLMLDLVIRNEDRLPCRELRWRGNSANLLLAEKVIPATTDTLEEAFDSAMHLYRPRVIRALQKERRSTSVDSRLSSHSTGLISPVSDISDMAESPSSFSNTSLQSPTSSESSQYNSDFNIVAIDSGVPRRPPAGKRAIDQANYPKLVELLLNSSEFAFNLLHDVTCGKLGSPFPEDTNSSTTSDVRVNDMTLVVQAFRSGFRAALRDLQGFHIFLLTLHQKLDSLLRSFMSIMSKISMGEFDKEDSVACPDSPSQGAGGAGSCSSPTSKDRFVNENLQDCDSESHRTAQSQKASSSGSGSRDNSEFFVLTREGWHGKSYKGSGEALRSLRLTSKLRDFHRFAKVDAESNKELEQWNEMLKNDAVKLCQENNFNTGFFEGSDNYCVIDAYELKVRLEHILERIALISEAANSEKPALVTNNLFIGGALAAKSLYTLQQLGITHIICLCTNEIGQSDSQFPDLFTYKNFSICDDEDSNISSIFEEACDVISNVENKGERVLVHCFEGRSRSVTLVLAYLILRKKLSLLEAWNTLKRVHRRAQPNDGFAKMLVELDQKVHGKVSMVWQQRKPMIKVCPICGKNVGLSSSSLKLHLQKSHKRLSSGSVDSAMRMEIQKALAALKITRGGSVSPTQRQSHSHSIMDQYIE